MRNPFLIKYHISVKKKTRKKKERKKERKKKKKAQKIKMNG